MKKLRSTLFIALSPAGVDVSAFLACLRSHPGILCHADMQGPLSESGFAGLDEGTLKAARKSEAIAAFKRGFPEAYLYKYLLDSRGSEAVGFAVDYDTLLSPVNAPLRNVLQYDVEVKVLAFAPRNILREYAADPARRQGTQAVAVEPQKFLLHAKQRDRIQAYVEQFFQHHARMKVHSEDLLPSRLQGTLKAVAELLDVERFPGAKGKDAGQPELKALISNLDAVKAALRDTPYSWMLES